MKVVPLASSHIVGDWASNLIIDADHRSICKFGGFDDPKYRDRKNTMKAYLKEIEKEKEILEADVNRESSSP